MKNDPVLPLPRFLDLLAAYGGDLERWPAAERAAARALLAESAEARRAADAERPLDAVFAAASAAPRALDPDFERRLLAIPSDVRRPLGGFRRPRTWLTPAFGLAAAAVLGFFLGSYADALEGDGEEGAVAIASEASDEELFVELALGDTEAWEATP